MHNFLKLLALAAVLGLAACVSAPTGPSVMVLPGTGKSFDEFRFDEGQCRQFAYDQIGGQTAAQAQENSAITSAAVGTAVGALAGAAIGGNSNGAAVGAGVGLLGGSMAGSDASQRSAYGAQRRYDIAYQQCMYAKGHRIPVAGQMQPRQPAPPRTNYPPPPPPPPNQPPPG
jgi:YmgG-like glycine-zipper protein